MGRRIQGGKDAIKKVLDRRYAERSDVIDLAERILDLEGGVAMLRNEAYSVARNEVRCDHVDQLKALESKIASMTKLIEECASAIELSLQAELLIRRDLDAVTRQT